MLFVKLLLKTRKNLGGRNSLGRITVRHRGAKVGKRFIFVNFRRRVFLIVLV